MHTHMYKVVKVWDISSGKNVFEFCADMGKEVGIRTMDVDRAGKRYVSGNYVVAVYSQFYVELVSSVPGLLLPPLLIVCGREKKY